MQGANDYNCPTTLVEAYFKIITAPIKRLYIFNYSAHAPNYEEPERFHLIVKEIVEESAKLAD